MTTSINLTLPRGLCTRGCGRKQSKMQRAKYDGVPLEQHTWCGVCRGNAKAEAVWVKMRAAAPRRTRGQTHCVSCPRAIGSKYAQCYACREGGVSIPDAKESS